MYIAPVRNRIDRILSSRRRPGLGSRAGRPEFRALGEVAVTRPALALAKIQGVPGSPSPDRHGGFPNRHSGRGSEELKNRSPGRRNAPQLRRGALGKKVFIFAES